MRRFFSYFLILILVLPCFIFSSLAVSASNVGVDSETNGYTFDGLPYLSNQYFDTLDLSTGGSLTFTYNPPVTSLNRYIEGVLVTNDPNPSFSSESANFALTDLGGGLFHFICDLSNVVKDTYSITYVKGGGGFFEFLTFNVTPTDYIKDNLTFSVNMSGSYTYKQYNDFTSDQAFINISSSFNETDSISGSTYASPPLLHENTNTSQFQYNEQNVFVTSFIYFDWTNYDRVDFMLWNGYDSIIDCTFYVDGVSVLKGCYPGISPNSASMVSLDFSSLDPNINSNLCYIRIRGNKVLNSSNSKNLILIPKSSAFVSTVSNNFWPSWLNKILDKLDSIFTGRAQDQLGADSFNESVIDQSSELQDLTDIMTSVDQPDITDVNLNLNGVINPSTVTLATTGFKTILQNEIILKVLLTAFTFALVGFVLYGKKG